MKVADAVTYCVKVSRDSHVSMSRDVTQENRQE
jgi:hypothetical protein